MKDCMFNHMNIRCFLPVEMLAWGRAVRMFLLITVSFLFSCSQPQNWEFRSRTGMNTCEFPDGSKVTLREGATLDYADDFGESNREVTIDGEGYFEIRHDPRHRFIAHCNGVTVTVLGTAFNIRLSPTGEVEVTVTEGKVNLSDSQRNFGDLLPNRQALIDPARHLVRYPERVDLDKTLAWIYKGIPGGREGMAVTLSTLEARYGTTIVVENKALYGCTTTSFSGEPDDSMALKDILGAMAKTLNATVEPYGDNGYIIRGGTCN